MVLDIFLESRDNVDQPSRNFSILIPQLLFLMVLSGLALSMLAEIGLLLLSLCFFATTKTYQRHTFTSFLTILRTRALRSGQSE